MDATPPIKTENTTPESADPARPVFRAARDSDASQLESMILGFYSEDTYGAPMTPEKIRRTLNEFSKHPEKGRVVMFELAAKTIGYALLVHYWSNEFGGNLVSIDELYVCPTWRNHGIGTAFLRYLEEQVLPSSVGLQLEVTVTNERAHRYYLRNGFLPAYRTLRKLRTAKHE